MKGKFLATLALVGLISTPVLAGSVCIKTGGENLGVSSEILSYTRSSTSNPLNLTVPSGATALIVQPNFNHTSEAVILIKKGEVTTYTDLISCSGLNSCPFSLGGNSFNGFNLNANRYFIVKVTEGETYSLGTQSTSNPKNTFKYSFVSN